MKKKLIYGFYLLNILIILYFWWTQSGIVTDYTFINIFMAVARLAGLLAVLSVLTQFTLMGRAVWIEQLFGLDKLARIHRINGYITITFVILHPVFIIWSYAINGKKGFFEQLWSFLTQYDDLLNALIAVLLFITVVGTSIYIVRKRLKFETWYYVHLITYAAVILAWGHQLQYGSDFVNNKLFTIYWYAIYTFVFGNLLYFRFFRPIYNFINHRFYIEKIVPETETVNSVYITGKKMESFKAKAGQFVLVRFIKRGFLWDTHPFSISAYPDGKHIRLSIKALGDFTNKIPQLQAGTNVFIEGPYGIFTKDILTKEKVAFIAGGIGITPIRSLIEDCVKSGKDCILLYGNRFIKEIAFKKELEELQQAYPFVIHHILSDEEIPGEEKGFVDKAKIEKYIPDIKERDVFLCGPPIMMQKVRAALAELNVNSKDVHFELFSLV